MTTKDGDCSSIEGIETSSDEGGGFYMTDMELSLQSDFGGGDDSAQGALEESGDLFVMASDFPSDSNDETSCDGGSAQGALEESGDLFEVAVDLPSESNDEPSCDDGSAQGAFEESGDLFEVAVDLPSDGEDLEIEGDKSGEDRSDRGVAGGLRDGSRARPTAPGNHNRTDAEIWEDRCSMSVIEDALKEKCNCNCISRFQHGAVFEQRRMNARRSVKERKKVFMQTLKFFSTASGSMQYKSHDGLRCCRKGWAIEQGHIESYVSRGIESLKEGNLCADPNNGGKNDCLLFFRFFLEHIRSIYTSTCLLTGRRISGIQGGDHGLDSPGSMSIRSWLTNMLPNWSDHCPMSGRIELEKMTHEDLYLIFLNDMLALESMPFSDVPRMPLFLKIWKEEFPHIVSYANSKQLTQKTRLVFNFLLYARHCFSAMW